VICVECHRNKAEVGTDTCFRCRVATVNFGWRGGGFVYGRSNFSARTNEEFLNEHVGDVRNHPNIERADPL
jgi:hypothetical protein